MQSLPNYYFSAMGPVRLFTPYKRRRRTNVLDPDDIKPKIKRDSSLGDSDDVDNIHQTSSNSHSKEAWQTLAEGLDSNSGYHLLADTPDGSSDPNTGKQNGHYHRFIQFLFILQ